MNSIEKYFNAEKSESILFVLVGVMAILFATYFFTKLKQPIYNGMAYPFIAVAMIQIVVGGSIFVRSPKDILRVNHIVGNERLKIQAEEIPRMETVMKNFVLYRWIEISLIVLGIILFFIFPNSSFWRGVGIGLIIQAGFMLLLDYFAERRGSIYLQYLKNL